MTREPAVCSRALARATRRGPPVALEVQAAQQAPAPLHRLGGGVVVINQRQRKPRRFCSGWSASIVSSWFSNSLAAISPPLPYRMKLLASASLYSNLTFRIAD